MREWKLTAAILALASCLVLIAFIQGLSVLLFIGGGLGAVIFLWMAFRYPVLFLVAVLIMPQLKDYWPLQPLDRVADLTVVMLVGLSLGVGWKLLKFAARMDNGPRLSLSKLPKWPMIGFGVFALVVALSYTYTPAVSYGGTELLRFLGIGTLLLISPFVLIRTEEDLRRFVVLFLAAGGILALQMILHLEDRQSTSDQDITRIGAGWLMGMLILLALYYHPFRRAKHNTIQAWVLVPIFSFALIASAARGPIIGLLVVLILNLVTSTRMLSRIVITVLLLGVSTAAAFAVFSQIDPGKYNSKLSEIVDLVEGKAASGSAVQRLKYYRQTLAALPNHPFFGEGVGSWSVFYYGTDKRAYPHNLLLQIAFEQGLLGVCAMGFFLITVGAVGVRLIRRTGTRYAVFPSLVLFCAIVSMFSGDLDDNRVLWYWTGITLAVCGITAARYSRSVVQRFTFRQPFYPRVEALSAGEMNGPLSSAH
jgi:O-antigen ligase